MKILKLFGPMFISVTVAKLRKLLVSSCMMDKNLNKQSLMLNTHNPNSSDSSWPVMIKETIQDSMVNSQDQF